jgi:DNA-binding response OmpR family regulator
MHEALIVENDPACRTLFAVVARRCGYDVGVAADGAEALSAIRSRSPHAIVLDLQLPKLNGFDVLRELPAELLRRTVVITAVAPSTLRDSDHLRRVRTVLQKPLVTSALIDALNDVRAEA